MTTLRTAAQQALEALELAKLNGKAGLYPAEVEEITDAITALRAALAEPAQEPVAWKDKTYESLHHQDFGNSIPLYTAPPRRKPLSAVDLRALYDQHAAYQEEGPEASGWWDFARAIERAHNIT